MPPQQRFLHGARWRIVALAVCTAGAALVCWIVLQVPGEVFNNGDGGLKALLARQLARGRFAVTLDLHAEPWVRELWARGYYPFEPPFVYSTPSGPISQFPFLFPALSAPFYAALGFRGFYVVPALSLFALWLVFVRAARRTGTPGWAPGGAPGWAVATALGALVLSSPLTLYGAMYYGHTLAVLVLFWGAVTVALPGERSRAALLAAGAIAGLAPWLRSEAWCMVGGLCLLAAARAVRGRRLAWGWFPAGVAVALGGNLACNRFVYGRWLGLHGEQIFGYLSLRQQLLRGAHHLSVTLRELGVYYPLTLFLLAALVTLLVARRPLPAGAGELAFLTLFDLVTTPFLLLSSDSLDWGPRYFLVLMPVLALMLALLLPALAAATRWQVAIAGVLGVVLVAGACKNCVEGPRVLLVNYRERVWPALVDVRRSPSPVVVINHQYGSMELESLLDEKAFLLVDDPRELAEVARVLAARGESPFLFLAFPYRPLPPRFGWGPPGARGHCVARGERGQFVLYDCTG
jgi:hypothetical protein